MSKVTQHMILFLVIAILPGIILVQLIHRSPISAQATEIQRDAEPSAASTGGAAAIGIAGIFAFGMLYFLPALVAQARKQSNVGAIAVLNLFLGWTVIGWIVALVWAFVSDRAPTVVQMQAPPLAILCGACGRYSLSGAGFCSTCGAPLMLRAAK